MDDEDIVDWGYDDDEEIAQQLAPAEPREQDLQQLQHQQQHHSQQQRQHEEEIQVVEDLRPSSMEADEEDILGGLDEDEREEGETREGGEVRASTLARKDAREGKTSGYPLNQPSAFSTQPLPSHQVVRSSPHPSHAPPSNPKAPALKLPLPPRPEFDQGTDRFKGASAIARSLSSQPASSSIAASRSPPSAVIAGSRLPAAVANTSTFNKPPMSLNAPRIPGLPPRPGLPSRPSNSNIPPPTSSIASIPHPIASAAPPARSAAPPVSEAPVALAQPAETAASSGETMSLPPGWQTRSSRKTGGTFYYNVNTQETSWTRPEVSAPLKKIATSAEDQAAGGSSLTQRSQANAMVGAEPNSTTASHVSSLAAASVPPPPALLERINPSNPLAVKLPHNPIRRPSPPPTLVSRPQQSIVPTPAPFPHLPLAPPGPRSGSRPAPINGPGPIDDRARQARQLGRGPSFERELREDKEMFLEDDKRREEQRRFAREGQSDALPRAPAPLSRSYSSSSRERDDRMMMDRDRDERRFSTASRDTAYLPPPSTESIPSNHYSLTDSVRRSSDPHPPLHSVPAAPYARYSSGPDTRPSSPPHHNLRGRLDHPPQPVIRGAGQAEPFRRPAIIGAARSYGVEGASSEASRGSLPSSSFAHPYAADRHQTPSDLGAGQDRSSSFGNGSRHRVGAFFDQAPGYDAEIEMRGSRNGVRASSERQGGVIAEPLTRMAVDDVETRGGQRNGSGPRGGSDGVPRRLSPEPRLAFGQAPPQPPPRRAPSPPNRSMDRPLHPEQLRYPPSAIDRPFPLERGSYDSRPAPASLPVAPLSDRRQPEAAHSQHIEHDRTLVPPFPVGAPDGIKLDTLSRSRRGEGRAMSGVDANYASIPVGTSRWGNAGGSLLDSGVAAVEAARPSRESEARMETSEERREREDRELEELIEKRRRERAEEDRLKVEKAEMVAREREREAREREVRERDAREREVREREIERVERERSFGSGLGGGGGALFADQRATTGGWGGGQEREEYDRRARDQEMRVRATNDVEMRQREERLGVIERERARERDVVTERLRGESPPRKAWAVRGREAVDDGSRELASRQEAEYRQLSSSVPSLRPSAVALPVARPRSPPPRHFAAPPYYHNDFVPSPPIPSAPIAQALPHAIPIHPSRAGLLGPSAGGSSSGGGETGSLIGRAPLPSQAAFRTQERRGGGRAGRGGRGVEYGASSSTQPPLSLVPSKRHTLDDDQQPSYDDSFASSDPEVQIISSTYPSHYPVASSISSGKRARRSASPPPALLSLSERLPPPHLQQQQQQQQNGAVGSGRSSLLDRLNPLPSPSSSLPPPPLPSSSSSSALQPDRRRGQQPPPSPEQQRERDPRPMADVPPHLAAASTLSSSAAGGGGFSPAPRAPMPPIPPFPALGGPGRGRRGGGRFPSGGGRGRGARGR